MLKDYCVGAMYFLKQKQRKLISSAVPASTKFEPIKNLSGEPIINTKNNKQWYQLGMEEAFFLWHSLKCFKILGGEDDFPKDDQEL